MANPADAYYYYPTVQEKAMETGMIDQAFMVLDKYGVSFFTVICAFYFIVYLTKQSANERAEFMKKDSENDESYDSDDNDDDRDDDEKSHSRRHVSPAQRYENIGDQHLKGARQNIFALLLHLVKEKDNNVSHHFLSVSLIYCVCVDFSFLILCTFPTTTVLLVYLCQREKNCCYSIRDRQTNGLYFPRICVQNYCKSDTASWEYKDPRIGGTKRRSCSVEGFVLSK